MDDVSIQGICPKFPKHNSNETCPWWEFLFFGTSFLKVHQMALDGVGFRLDMQNFCNSHMHPDDASNFSLIALRCWTEQCTFQLLFHGSFFFPHHAFQALKFLFPIEVERTMKIVCHNAGETTTHLQMFGGCFFQFRHFFLQKVVKR